MAVSEDDKGMTTRMNALLTSASITSETSLGQLSGTSSSGSGASIGALPVFVIDAPSSLGGTAEHLLGDLDGGDEQKDSHPIDRKVRASISTSNNPAVQCEVTCNETRSKEG